MFLYKIITSVFVFALLLCSVACPADSASEHCVVGSSQTCACSDGSQGAQTCLDDGSYGACSCSGTDAGSGDAGSGDASSPDVDNRTDCERMCDHVYVDCGQNFTTAGGDAISRSDCVIRCNAGDFSGAEISCFTTVVCNNLNSCFGQGGPVCPRDADCSERSCGLDPVCGESCGSCAGSASCSSAGACQSPDGWALISVYTGLVSSSVVRYDSSGNAHIAWINYDGTVLYAESTASGWQSSEIDQPGHGLLEQRLDMELASDGTPHVVYKAETTDHLYYAILSGSTWQTEVIDNTGEVGDYASLALDGDDLAHVAYRDSENGALKYATLDSAGVWHLDVVDNNVSAGFYTSIAVDSNSVPHIAYNRGYSSLQYAKANGAAWDLEEVSSEGVAFTSMALDDTDTPHIAFHGQDVRKLRYAVRGSTDWTLEDVDTIGDGNGWTSIGTVSGEVHIAYTETVFTDLKYAVGQAGAWNLHTLDDGGNAGMECSLTFTHSGKARILYQTNRSDERVMMALEP